MRATVYNIKEFVQPKMSLNNRKFLIWKERGGGREREGCTGRQACRSASRQVSKQAYLRLS
jgi:hypothetical protein